MRLVPFVLTIGVLAALPAQAQSRHVLRADSLGARSGTLGGVIFRFDDQIVFSAGGGAGGGRGFAVWVYDPQTGASEPVQVFDTWFNVSSGSQHQQLIDYLASVTAGRLVVVAVGDEAGLNQWDSCAFYSYPWIEAVQLAFEQLGATRLRSLCYRSAWAFAAVKGGGLVVEAINRNNWTNTATLDLVCSAGACPPFVKGDLDTDRGTDLLLRKPATGQNLAWLMNGVTRVSEALITPDPPSAAWQVAGVDDFDADDRNDLVVWDAVSGATEIWLMNGTARVGAPVSLGAWSPQWMPVATADFNHDGWPDILWRNLATEQLAIWAMSSTTPGGAITPTPDHAVDGNWQIVAALDMNKDGNADFLWYNVTSGKIVQWLMSGASGNASSGGSMSKLSGLFTNPPNAVDANWRVMAAGDYGVGPGGVSHTNDVVWRNSTSGRYVVWYLDDAGNKTAGTFTDPTSPADPLGWTIAGPR